MAVPKKKTSPSRQGMRWSHKKVAYSALSHCPNCGEGKRSHHICLACGHYKGRHVLVLKAQKRNEKAQAEST